METDENLTNHCRLASCNPRTDIINWTNFTLRSLPGPRIIRLSCKTAISIASAIYFCPLAMSFQRIFVAVRDNAVEAVQRRGVDDLVEMAFSGRLVCKQEVL